MFHSMYIGDKNTWDDYSLVPQSKIYIPVASQKTKVIQIEGANGSLDLSTLLTGYPVYGQRTGTASFYLLDAIDVKALTNSGYAYPANYTFYDIFDKLRGDLDGKNANMWLEDDPDWTYHGRFNVKCAMNDPRPSVEISYALDPYKIAKTPVAYDMNGLGSIINRTIIPAEIGTMPASFHFILTGGEGTITFQNPTVGIDQTRTFPAGEYTVYEWVVYGDTTILLSAGTGVHMHIEYFPGRL